ncbi:selenium metabolism protein YedF [Anaerobranca californiensis DSM 14826]|jgi:tRNA 2-thiouridine synthesizing protein A|uniref:Selenium metabolism protein YedF n=1 Tax=Anaerobranca californiensis DSM 14826 TaxID=1120989 RepID=A0A1M6Q3Q2_9FIRM|nr:sulfurtransferase-like selenium metabolism protein YedF [Anaerobranca californiensis]SHK14803.1 selenium metabolism protein YedF [Anaerobranca californiensis DSM 14826]
MKIIDNSKLPCPQPVINTKKAIEEGLPVKSIVDNEVAKENVVKFCTKLGLKTEVIKNGEKYEIIIGKDGELLKLTKNELEGTYLIKSKTLGVGDEKLGEGLMKAFIYTLTQKDKAPKRIMLLNSGVFLAVKGSQTVDDLKVLAQKGTEILSCGTCLDFYNVKEQLAVGTITNMYDIVENLTDDNTITL